MLPSARKAAPVRLHPRFLPLLLLPILMAGCATANAQSDTRGLVDRLDRLERDVGTLQSQVYRGGGSGGSGGGAPVTGSAYDSLDSRLGRIEQQVRDLTGQVEQADFNASQLSAKLERMQADIDLRFKELEQKSGGSAPASTAGTADAPAAPGAPPGSLVHGNKPAGQAQTQQPVPPAQSGAPVTLVGRTPQEKYDYAFSLLRNNDHAGAAKAFDTFIAQYPDDPLAGNATYWQAQIYFAQSQWDQAAPLFLKAYRNYPKSAKAGESLLKLGMALGNMGKKQEACAALSRFTTEYPQALDTLKRTAASEKSKQGC